MIAEEEEAVGDELFMFYPRWAARRRVNSYSEEGASPPPRVEQRQDKTDLVVKQH